MIGKSQLMVTNMKPRAKKCYQRAIPSVIDCLNGMQKPLKLQQKMNF